MGPDEAQLIQLRDCRMEQARLRAEIKSVQDAGNAERLSELQTELSACERKLREAQAFLDLNMIPPEARIMVSHYYGMVASDLTNRSKVAELNQYLPQQQAPRSQEAMEYLFKMWEQLKELGVEVLPIGSLAGSHDVAELKQGADLFGRLAITAARG